MNNTNFAGAIVTNPAEHVRGRREVYAERARNCRSDPQGWLIPRKGNVRILDEANITSCFVHRNVILGVQLGVLKLARITDIDGNRTPRLL